MMQTNYTLADVGGILCIRAESPDYNAPTLVAVYWPTTIRTFDFLKYHEQLPSQLAGWIVTQSRPGEYYAKQDAQRFASGSYLPLVNGGQTQPIQTEQRPAPRPKTRLPVEWDCGRWFKVSAKGRVAV